MSSICYMHYASRGCPGPYLELIQPVEISLGTCGSAGVREGLCRAVHGKRHSKRAVDHNRSDRSAELDLHDLGRTSL